MSNVLADLVNRIKQAIKVKEMTELLFDSKMKKHVGRINLWEHAGVIFCYSCLKKKVVMFLFKQLKQIIIFSFCKTAELIKIFTGCSAEKLSQRKIFSACKSLDRFHAHTHMSKHSFVVDKG